MDGASRVNAVIAEANDVLPAPIKDWPTWVRRLFFKRHKDRNERFDMFVFFFRNGASPEQSARWVMYPGVYDASAHRSMQDAVRQANINPQYFDRFRVFDLAAGYPWSESPDEAAARTGIRPSNYVGR